MNFFNFFLSIGLLVILCCLGAGLFEYLRNKAVISNGDGKQEDYQLRLDEMDRRLTDIQDVMIALSEKFDRFDSQAKWAKGEKADVG
ncbi:MAG: hypothetical protein GKR89_36185 [Candidatus Latescibacteria bacterium]|nr:hypothetical protein [Candidatus Latescibacterota bacterium]